MVKNRNGESLTETCFEILDAVLNRECSVQKFKAGYEADRHPAKRNRFVRQHGHDAIFEVENVDDFGVFNSSAILLGKSDETAKRMYRMRIQTLVKRELVKIHRTGASRAASYIKLTPQGRRLAELRKGVETASD